MMAELLNRVILFCLAVLQNSVMATPGEVKHARVEQVLQGSWDLLLENAGVSAMHMALMHTNKVLMFDQTEAGPSNITLRDPACMNFTPSSPVVPSECWAHSVEYNIQSNTVRPLHLYTDTFCSSGAFASDGILVNTGGFDNGFKKTRYYMPCRKPTCNWIESGTHDLSDNRWYASNQILPDNRVIVVGGQNSYSYEFVPKRPGEGAFILPFLEQTTDSKILPGEYNNLYPFLHLSSDGNLFIYANRDSILFDYNRNKVVRIFPTLPGGPRNYPCSGSSVMLPLNFADNYRRVEVMICGGAPRGSYVKAGKSKVFDDALNTCGRMEITALNPWWAMEFMPGSRVMGDMLILPTGEILIINGARSGSAGYQDAREPQLSPWLYRPEAPLGNRFTVLAATGTPRMYHSTAIVLPDGRVLVAGSNSNYGYIFSDLFYTKTDLSVQAYVPYYLHPQYDAARVNIVAVSSVDITYNSTFRIDFSLGVGTLGPDVRFHAYAPPFNTHTMSMNQRMLLLAPASSFQKGNDGLYSVDLKAPPNSVVAPSGYYLLTIVHGSVPSKAEWIRFL